LLPALLLQVRPTVSSEQQLMEQLDYNLLYRSLVGLSIGDLVWDVTVSTENRERLLASDVANRVFHQVVAVARAQGLLSVEHLTVDGTLIEAWAGQKSTKQPPLDVRGNPSVDFRGERCANATPQSTTDPRARPYKKAGQEAKFYHKGHLLRIATAC